MAQHPSSCIWRKLFGKVGELGGGEVIGASHVYVYQIVCHGEKLNSCICIPITQHIQKRRLLCCRA